MVRRGSPDPLLLQTVSERLARLLAEGEPQRADAAEPTPPAPPEVGPTGPPSGGALSGALDELSEPPRFRRAHLGVVAVLMVLGLLVAGWGVLRARPVALASPDPAPSTVVVSQVSTPPSPVPSPMPTGAGPAAALVVHVLGAVRRPGLVRLPAPARVQDAVDAAGGFTRAADPGELNLAQLLTDGQQILIGTRDEPEGQVRGSSGGTGSSGTGLPTGSSAGGAESTVDLNAADATQLEELPGVGPVTATKIVAWRDEHGRFARVEELQEIDGIGPKTYAEIAPHVRV